MSRIRSLGRQGNRLAKIGFLTAALCLIAVPAFALAETENPSGEYMPEEPPPSYTGGENPGGEYTPEGVPLAYSGTDNPGIANMPADVPPGYNGNENPGADHRTSGAEARALGRDECQEFKQNFAQNKSQFGKCIAAVAKALRTGATPRKACASQGLSRKPQGDEHRSDFRACVVAAARALREQANS